MRVSERDLTYIINAVKDRVGQNKFELRLFGSRVDDHKKGGDLDLVLILSNDSLVGQKNLRPHLFTLDIKKKIGDRKIDFHIISEKDLEEPFWSLALENSKVLN